MKNQPNVASKLKRWLVPIIIGVFVLGLSLFPRMTRAKTITSGSLLEVDKRLSCTLQSEQFFKDGISWFALHAPEAIFFNSDPFHEPAQDACQNQSIAIRVIAPGIFNLPVIQQPAKDPIYVSVRSGEITQFGRASKFGSTGLLAHNYLSGKDFLRLNIGQKTWVAYENGAIRRFQITDSYSFQKLDPSNPTSNFRDLRTGKILTSTQVFNRFYRLKDYVIFQTCLEANGDPSWGLLFVVAAPQGSS